MCFLKTVYADVTIPTCFAPVIDFSSTYENKLSCPGVVFPQHRFPVTPCPVVQS